METHPPRLIEALVERLLPHACRENVMGDWAERYRSPQQYVFRALAALPRIIASQVRRTFRLGLFLGEASVLYIAFGAASLVGGPAYLYDHRLLIPLVIVIGIALFVLILRDAYTNSEDLPEARARRDIGFALGCAVCLEALLFAFTGSRWTVPLWLLIVGSAAAVPMLYMLRRFSNSWRQGNAEPAGGPMSLDALREKSKDEHRKAWRLNLVWLIGGLAIIFTNPNIRGARDGGNAISGLLLIAIVWVLFWRSKHGLNRAQEYKALSIAADPYRNQLERKRDGLQFWAGGSGGVTIIFVLLAFPLTLLLFGWMSGKSLPAGVSLTHVWISLVALCLLCACWAFVRKANIRAARAIQDELDAMEASEKR
jgi:hypothetical protein